MNKATLSKHLEAHRKLSDISNKDLQISVKVHDSL